MTNEEITELAAKIRQSLRDQGLLPAYTDMPKGPIPQPPLLQAMLENAIREHISPLVRRVGQKEEVGGAPMESRGSLIW